jgi:hypothetical protein
LLLHGCLPVVLFYLLLTVCTEMAGLPGGKPKLGTKLYRSCVPLHMQRLPCFLYVVGRQTIILSSERMKQNGRTSSA